MDDLVSQSRPDTAQLLADALQDKPQGFRPQGPRTSGGNDPLQTLLATAAGVSWNTLLF